MIIKSKTISLQELGKRDNQEDSIYPPVSDNECKGSDLYILCDGMGGHDCGEVASQNVCSTMSEYVLSNPREDGLFDKDDFYTALNVAYDRLDSLDDNQSEKKMGTTLTFLKIHRGGVFIAHIGDSRIYHIRPSAQKILHVTRDHSLVNFLISLGELTPEEARTSKQKNIITKAIQPNQGCREKADCLNITDVREGDYFYMCSDGMLEISEDDEICNVICMRKRTDVQKMAILKDVTKDNFDNHSAHLIHITSVKNEKEDGTTVPIGSFMNKIPSEVQYGFKRILRRRIGRFALVGIIALCVISLVFLVMYFLLNTELI